MFLLALCQPGAEKALVDETGLSRAFSSKGLVTLKSAADLAVDDVPMPVFARHIGISLGKVSGVDDAKAKAAAAAAALGYTAIDVVHEVVHEVRRAQTSTRQAALSAADRRVDSRDARAAGRVEGGARATSEPEPRSQPTPVPAATPVPGQLVLTVVDGWASVHRHESGRSPFPGGTMPPELLPPEAPSRAWLKLEEAIRTFDLPFEKGQQAIDIGCAPGGASFNLLQRGLEVVGIDPNDMPLKHPRLTHIKRTSMSVDPADSDWVLLDVNVPPGTALRGAMPFIERARVGIVLTLKMKDWSLAREVDGWLRRIHGFELIARQLSSNGQEICVAGMRE